MNDRSKPSTNAIKIKVGTSWNAQNVICCYADSMLRNRKQSLSGAVNR